MPIKNFTAQWVANTPGPELGRIEYFDAKTTGLGLRVSAGGRKTWFVMYRAKGDPRKHRLTLDGYPALSLADVRQLAQEALLAASRGQDPAQAKQELKQAATFANLAAEYLEKHAKRKKRSWQEDARVSELKGRLEHWAKDHGCRLQDADPALPNGLATREAENWRHLIASADLAGGRWPELARTAAILVSGKPEPSGGEMLLRAIKRVWPPTEVRMRSEALGRCRAPVRPLRGHSWRLWRVGVRHLAPASQIAALRTLAPERRRRPRPRPGTGPQAATA